MTVGIRVCMKDITVAMLKIRKKNMAFWQHKNILLISVYWDILEDKIPDALTNSLQFAKDFKTKTKEATH